jgi:predicted transcriptional regulator
MRAIWHPTRAQIVELLTSGPATQSQLVKAAGGPRATIAYHSRVLCRAGCIKAVECPDSTADDPLFEAV